MDHFASPPAKRADTLYARRKLSGQTVPRAFQTEARMREGRDYYWDRTLCATNIWVSPQRLSDDPKLALLADLNDWAPAERMTFVPHTTRGPRMAQGDSRLRSPIMSLNAVAFHPRRYGAAGGNVVLLDGSAR